MTNDIITEIKTLQDLITIAKNTNIYQHVPEENRNKLQNLLPTLIKLNNLIGLKKIKNQIVHQIIYYIQKFNDSNQDMLHTCIEGEPGCGKTTLGKILGEIYCKLGILSTNKFTLVKRSDLIAGYLGQTAIKTQKVLDEAKGGVLFIDEAYSLGNQENRDSFSKECIDTINRFLTENKEDFVCIIAGYKNSLKECFFSVNPGLERRFPWKYSIDTYSPDELLEIFKYQVKMNGYILESKSIDTNFFKVYQNFFKNSGGDTETFFNKCKIYHSNRVFFLPRRHRKILIDKDIQNAINVFKESSNENRENQIHHIYI
jgi:SpoVK/Ycf46/Vps4 family AAA+-type ATPase